MRKRESGVCLFYLSAAERKCRTCKLELIFDSLLTSQHPHPSLPPSSSTPLLTTHPPEEQQGLLSCPVLTQFSLITHKVYIKAGQIHRSAATWQQGKRNRTIPSIVTISRRARGCQQVQRQGGELINRMVIVLTWVIFCSSCSWRCRLCEVDVEGKWKGCGGVRSLSF